MMRAIPIILVLLLAVGCSPKEKPPPSPAIESAIKDRLSDYSAAWFAGDATGVSSSFNQTHAEEHEFAVALGRLATAQKDLVAVQSTVPEQITSTVQMSEGVPMIALNRPWHYYAYAASRPPIGMKLEEPDLVAVQMVKSGEYTLELRNVQGRWLIEPTTWAKDRPVSILTDSLLRQITLTTNGTAAIRAQNWDKLKSIMQQMHQQRMVDKISDSTTYTLP
jgi:hypothetical protein